MEGKEQKKSNFVPKKKVKWIKERKEGRKREKGGLLFKKWIFFCDVIYIFCLGSRYSIILNYIYITVLFHLFVLFRNHYEINIFINIKDSTSISILKIYLYYCYSCYLHRFGKTKRRMQQVANNMHFTSMKRTVLGFRRLPFN